MGFSMEELWPIGLFVLLPGILICIQGRRLCSVLVFMFRLFINWTRSLKINCWNPRVLFGGQGSIPISDLKHCKKILSHPAWPDRVRPYSAIHSASYGKPLGLIFGCGEEYKRARRVSNKIFSHIGFHNCSKMEGLVEVRVSQLLNNLHELVSKQNTSHNDDSTVRKGATWCPKRKLNHLAVAIVVEILFGKNLPNVDAVIELVVNGIDEGNRKFKVRGFTWFAEDMLISKLRALCLRMWAWYSGSYAYYSTVMGIIQEKRRGKSEGRQESSTFLDAYLGHLDRMTDFEMTDEDLLVVLRDIVSGTGETVGSALEFAILYLALNPSVQDRLRTEIDLAVGRSRRPLYSDKSNMPYAQATILEVLRQGSVISPGERVAVDDNTIGETFYPKGTVVAIKHYEIHRSRELWDDPELFRPERFLSKDGCRVENKGKIIPFGYGTRFCIGESFAQVALFMFLTGLVQEFSFEIPAGMPRPDGSTIRGQARSPTPYFVQIIPTDVPAS